MKVESSSNGTSELRTNRKKRFQQRESSNPNLVPLGPRKKEAPPPAPLRSPLSPLLPKTPSSCPSSPASSYESFASCKSQIASPKPILRESIDLNESVRSSRLLNKYLGDEVRSRSKKRAPKSGSKKIGTDLAENGTEGIFPLDLPEDFGKVFSRDSNNNPVDDESSMDSDKTLMETNNATRAPIQENADAKTELERVYGSVDFSVEVPCGANGQNYQIRCTIYDQLFIGRSPTESEATARCCGKAVKYIRQHKLGPYAEEGSEDRRGSKRGRKKRRRGGKEEENDESSVSGASKSRRDRRKKRDRKTENEEEFDFKNIPIKNAVMMLNEMFPPPRAPQYKVLSQTGPPNNPTFSMMCTVTGKSYIGEGKSKKEAKLACSQKSIEYLCGYKRSETKSVPEKSNPRANCDLDDWMELEGKNPVSILNELYPGIQYQLLSTTGPSHAPNFIIKSSLNDISFEGSGKSKKDAKLNASKALLVYLHKVGFDPMTGDMISTRENTDATADGHSFADRIGQLVYSKYQELFGTTTYSKRRVMSSVVMTTDSEDPKVVCVTSGTKCINGEQISLEGCVINDSHAEIVARRCLVYYLYCQLGNTAKEEESIFEKGEADAKFQLKDGIEFHLFITTSPCGDARIFSLHESKENAAKKTKPDKQHTESVNNKAENETEEKGKPETDVDSNNNEVKVDLDSESTKEKETFQEVPNEPEIEVKEATDSKIDEENKPEESTEDKETIEDEEIKPDEFHEAESEPQEPIKETTDKANKEPEKKADSSRGMLRSKIECGMGTVPINPKIQIQTWDGVMSGDRLLTMACSDKILRWNVLGVQGSCLTHLIEPIYLSSITVGSKFHPGHMKRALYERIAPYMTDLPAGYKVNSANLLATTSPETRQATKAHDYSVNWVVDQGQPEIVNGSTGMTINDTVSRLSKKMLFGKFLEVNPNFLEKPFRSPCRYSEVKQMASEYQEAKVKLNSALKEAGCGVWIEKPIEQDQFSL